MENRSRTQFSAVNTTVALLSRVTAILMGFITRVVFTHTLSESYVGINGLFTDILNVLSLTELGVGTAITYALYRPVADQDKEKQKSLMRMYRNFYRIVAGSVTVFGLAVLPFLDVLIKNSPEVLNLQVIYLMYLANSVLSYLLIYKRTLMDAHQLSYIGTLYQTVFLVVQDAAQIAVLLYTKNFMLFLSIYLLCTLLGNICISRKADRLYPYIKEKRILPLPAEEKREISRNIKAMLMHKAGSVAVNNTDNLLLSSMVGIISVGCYSNYYLLIGSIRQIADQMFQGITASVGNLGAREEAGRVKKIFEAAFFVGQWMYGLSAICLFELLNSFVELSFGKNYLFPEPVVFVLCLNFYVNGMRKAVLVFRDSLGLFWFDRYKAIAEAALNLLVSILLALRYGTVGVFLGTLVSMALTSLWVEPYVLYKHHLKAPVRSYFKNYACYAAVLFGCWFLTDLLCGMAEGSVWQVLGIRLLFCLLVPNSIMLLLYFRKAEFRFLKERAVSLWQSLKRRRRT